jgi:putative hydrolase of the HAD superfamily
MIKNIIFDIGNVLVSFRPMEYLQKHLPDPALAETLYKEIFCSDEWPKLDLGVITEEEAIGLFCMRNPDNTQIIRKLMSSWYDMLMPMEESINILRQLKARKYNTYVLSNYHLRAFEKIHSSYDFFNIFDGLVVSSHINMLKPSPEIYKHLVSSCSIKPEESLFIDDTDKNIYAAEKLGFHTILFAGADDLLKQLKNQSLL